MVKSENRKIVSEIEHSGQSLIEAMNLLPSKEMQDAIVAVRAAISTAKRLAAAANVTEMQEWARRLLETTGATL